MTDDRLFFRQLRSGEQFATGNIVASQMANFVYAIGDSVSREVVLVDPAYDVGGLVSQLEAEDMSVVGVVGTHYHPDHIGGSMMGLDIEGVAALLDVVEVPVYLQKPEVEFAQHTTGLPSSAFTTVEPGHRLKVGEVEIELIHTPGHTPGSQCLLVDTKLVTGDTLFLEGCGRTDLPGGDAGELYHSLNSRLAGVDDEVTVCPGHKYSAESTMSMGSVRRQNSAYSVESLEDWLRFFG